MAKQKNPGVPGSEGTAASAAPATPKLDTIHAFPIASDVELNEVSKTPSIPSSRKSYLWQFGPAFIQFTRKVDFMLTENAKERNLDLSKVERIRVARRKSETVVFMFATKSDDENGIEVKRSASKQYVNLLDFMVPRSLGLPTNEARRFDVVVAGEESPVGPAIKFDTAKPLETKMIKRKKSEEQIAIEKAVAKAKARAKAKAEAKARAKAKAEPDTQNEA